MLPQPSPAPQLALRGRRAVTALCLLSLVLTATGCGRTDARAMAGYGLRRRPRALGGAVNRDYVVDHLRRVATIQQWGVWGAGLADKPGNKDGWEDDDDVWITNTVGFAGPHERYTLAVMYILGGGETFHQGSNALTQISSLLFRGHHAPQPVAEATP